jgi:hypothetical protein
MSYPRYTTGRAGKGRLKTTRSNSRAPPYREIQMKIGQELKAYYEPQQELPGSLLRLLKRIDNSANEMMCSQR